MRFRRNGDYSLSALDHHRVAEHVPGMRRLPTESLQFCLDVIDEEVARSVAFGVHKAPELPRAARLKTLIIIRTAIAQTLAERQTGSTA